MLTSYSRTHVQDHFKSRLKKTFSFLNYKKRLIKQLESKAVDLTDMAAVGIGYAGDAICSPVGRPKKIRKIVSPIEIATPDQHLVGSLILKGGEDVKTATPQRFLRDPYSSARPVRQNLISTLEPVLLHSIDHKMCFF